MPLSFEAVRILSQSAERVLLQYCATPVFRGDTLSSFIYSVSVPHGHWSPHGMCLTCCSPEMVVTLFLELNLFSDCLLLLSPFPLCTLCNVICFAERPFDKRTQCPGCQCSPICETCQICSLCPSNLTSSLCITLWSFHWLSLLFSHQHCLVRFPFVRMSLSESTIYDDFRHCLLLCRRLWSFLWILHFVYLVLLCFTRSVH